MEQRAFGANSKGDAALLYTFTNKNGMMIGVTDLGATLHAVLVPDRDGSLCDVVLGYDTAEQYEEGATFFGATVGRSANRIGGASFVLNGEKYNLDKNDGENNLHSGLDFYSFRVWKVKEQTENSITFALHSPDGDQNYPGELGIEVTYTLTDDNEIKIKLTLARIVSRIDIKFIKVASDDPTIEVPYKTGNIFGSTEVNPLTSLIFKPTNIPLKYNLYGEWVITILFNTVSQLIFFMFSIISLRLVRLLSSRL